MKTCVNMNKEKALLLCSPLTATSMDALQNYQAPGLINLAHPGLILLALFFF